MNWTWLCPENRDQTFSQENSSQSIPSLPESHGNTKDTKHSQATSNIPDIPKNPVAGIWICLENLDHPRSGKLIPICSKIPGKIPGIPQKRFGPKTLLWSIPDVPMSPIRLCPENPDQTLALPRKTHPNRSQDIPESSKGLDPAFPRRSGSHQLRKTHPNWPQTSQKRWKIPQKHRKYFQAMSRTFLTFPRTSGEGSGFAQETWITPWPSCPGKLIPVNPKPSRIPGSAENPKTFLSCFGDEGSLPQKLLRIFLSRQNRHNPNSHRGISPLKSLELPPFRAAGWSQDPE